MPNRAERLKALRAQHERDVEEVASKLPPFRPHAPLNRGTQDPAALLEQVLYDLREATDGDYRSGDR